MYEKPKKRFGQNFLETSWVKKVINAIDPDQSDYFIEIGAGRGALTLPGLIGLEAWTQLEHLDVFRLYCVLESLEIDHALAHHLKTIVPNNVQIIKDDVLTLDLAKTISPKRQEEPTKGNVRWRVAGNLPYGISSPVLGLLVDLHRKTGLISDATVMLQKEVADRLLAKPGSRNYGVLGILMSLHADTKELLILPSGAFRPSPRVTSSLVRLSFRIPLISLANEKLFERMVRTMFTQRRKNIANALHSFATSTSLSAAEALTKAGLDPRRRPETLNLEELASLANIFENITSPKN